MQQFVCLSGLPRSGSTLLSALLSQNHTIHAEGNSAVCQLMWDMYESCTNKASEQLKANNRHATIRDLISQLPQIYYKNIPKEKQIVVDKCRSWTIPINIALLKEYIEPHLKIIVLERSITDIVKSFAKLYKLNSASDINQQLQKLLTPNSEPIMRSITGINAAKRSQQNEHFIFIQYEVLIAQPDLTMERIYAFCGWAPFSHNFSHIINQYPENDEHYQLKGFHSVRPNLAKQPNDVVLDAEILKKCETIDRLMGYA